jgi:hypothetical protein
MPPAMRAALMAMQGVETPLWLLLVIFLTIVCILLFFIQKGRGGFPFHKPTSYSIRTLAALKALDEAVGRATELGRPIHFTLGAGRFTPDTFAGFAMLGYLARQCASYDCQLIVTNMQVTVHMASQEIVRAAYTEAGFPDRFRADNVRFISKDEFPYVAGALSVIRAEQAAANVLLGTCGAASLILVEGAHSAGAYQIAGTDDGEQLPFYFVACEQVLLGEEIYGAGAALGNDPIIKGSFRGQDLLRTIIIAAIICLTLLVTINEITGSALGWLDQFASWLRGYSA